MLIFGLLAFSGRSVSNSLKSSQLYFLLLMPSGLFNPDTMNESIARPITVGRWDSFGKCSMIEPTTFIGFEETSSYWTVP